LSSAVLQGGSVKLADSRRLSFSTVGSADGFPVLYMHGAIGSPLRVSGDLAATIERERLRWICVQRPGFGGSDPCPGRTIVAFASDLRELIARLELERVAVIGVSAGGPYALAFAHAAPDLVGAAAVCSSLSPLCSQWEVPGLAPHLRHGMRLLARHPRACAHVLDGGAAVARRHPDWMLALMRRGAPAPKDRELIEDAEAGGTAVAGLLAAARRGSAGLVEDFLVCSRGWGFALGEVEVPVHLWHGLQDRLVPAEHAWQLVSSLPDCRPAFDPDEGHFFFRRRVNEIVSHLVGAARTAAERSPGSPERVIRPPEDRPSERFRRAPGRS
jgi:pimeloyl-ACP methyl ester carboxylesterase